ncbi:MAG: UDP-N-acetylglucosamine--N-acetylmuramyl-(pentapeptide) pyrophosphoryl-undecaprenol N-acetylglucosamine transferase [Verrucomicrobia bacterium]|nr:UDP-N-acetylglucosamine--N-acetylmuramyl-(pentapeptide) pyrophosphoryl-undecaprenol N-acetylglucosamine transferase [Verrucomicrobiota bacterium]
MSTILIACGGTGGHLAPGIAIAEVLMDQGHRCLLLVSRKTVDAALTKKYEHIEFIPITGQGISGGVVARLKALGSLVFGFFACWKTIRREAPESVLLFGGFLSAAAGMAARVCGVPVALHEANGVPGKATRYLAPNADRIYLPEGLSLKGIDPSKVCYPGYPVRREIVPRSKPEARRSLDLVVDGKLLVVIGGSQGARALNDWAEENFESLAESGISIYCVSGLKQAKTVKRFHKNRAGEMYQFTRVPFSERMAEVLSAADLVLSRAGAGSIAELTVCRRPAILIPYPHASDDHQAANALSHARAGVARVLPQDQLAELDALVRALLDNEAELAAMYAALDTLNPMNAAEEIAADLLLLTERLAVLKNGGIDGA